LLTAPEQLFPDWRKIPHHKCTLGWEVSRIGQDKPSAYAANSFCFSATFFSDKTCSPKRENLVEQRSAS
jgi:hypothetical protein